MSDQVDVVDTAAVATAAVETPVAEVATMEAAMANVAVAEAEPAEVPTTEAESTDVESTEDGAAEASVAEAPVDEAQAVEAAEVEGAEAVAEAETVLEFAELEDGPAEAVSEPAEATSEPAEETAEETAPNDPSRFELPSHADIRVGVEIQEQCQAALEASGNVVVDCSSVERVDAAVLQCLGSLVGSLHEGVRTLEFADRTESFDRAVAVLGFDDLLFRPSSDQQG